MPLFVTGITDELLEKTTRSKFWPFTWWSAGIPLRFIWSQYHNFRIRPNSVYSKLWRSLKKISSNLIWVPEASEKLLRIFITFQKSSLGEFHKINFSCKWKCRRFRINLPKQTLVNIETRRHYDENTIPESIKDEIVTAFSVLAKVAEKIDIPEMDEFSSEAFLQAIWEWIRSAYRGARPWGWAGLSNKFPL